MKFLSTKEYLVETQGTLACLLKSPSTRKKKSKKTDNCTKVLGKN